MNIRRPVAFVTGSSRGIGLAIVSRLAKAGFNIVLNARTLSPALQEAARMVATHGTEVLTLPFDVSCVETHEMMVEKIIAHFGRIDCLVNNAGISVHSRGDLLDITPESFDEQIAVNIRGSFFLSQCVAKWMVSHPVDSFRSIINISSSNAQAVSIDRGEYCIAKSTIAMMSRLFALRLAEDGINVYDVAPGLIATDMTAGVKEMYEEKMSRGFSPINRWGSGDDVARIVQTLSSGEWGFVTGETFRVDGGLTISRY
jgi:NAD(P)-dependent dehydrogenase (short-subunit alcohol dehydrogenase family)